MEPGGVHGIFTLTLGHPGSARLADGALMPIRWSADGTRLFVIDGAFSPDSDRVYALNGQTGQRTLLGTFPPDAEVVDAYPDGRRAVVNLQQERSDAWLVEFPARR